MNSEAIAWDDGLDWADMFNDYDQKQAEHEDGEFAVLKKGKYPAVIHKIEKGTHTPSEGGKLPKCGKARVTFKADGGDQGTAYPSKNYYLATSTLKAVVSLFAACNVRPQSGERIDFDKCIGAHVELTLDVDKFTKRDGSTEKRNEVKWVNPPKVSAAPLVTPGPPSDSAGSPLF